MELRQLEYFVAVADTGGFGRAARRLRIVQAAVSQQIQRLERQLGVRLFDRDTRRVRLTAAGERLLPEARAVLAAADRTRRVAAELVAAPGRLRLGTSRAVDAGLWRLLDVAAEIRPGLLVRPEPLPLERRLSGVRDGDLDAAIVRAVDAHPGLELSPLWSQPAVVALPANHPLAGSTRLRLTDLAELPLRLAPRHDNPGFHDLVVSSCRTAGITPPPGPPFTGFQATLHAIGVGEPSWTVFYPLGEPPAITGVAIRELADLEVTVALATRPGPATPAIRQLLAAARRLERDARPGSAQRPGRARAASGTP